MKKTAWIGCVCFLALAGCGGASSDDGRETGNIDNDKKPRIDAGPQGGQSDDDEEDDDVADDDMEADDDVMVTPVEDDDVVSVEDDDIFTEVEDDDFAPVEPTPDDDLVITPPGDDDLTEDDDVPMMDDDVPMMDDDVPMMDDDVPMMDDDVPMMDDDIIVVEPEPVGPVDPGECELVGQSFGTGYCQLNEQCGGQYRNTYCNDLGTGAWSCQCSNNYVYSTYEFAGAEQDTACVQARDFCQDAVAPEFTGEPVCMPSYVSQTETYCQSSETCRRTVDLGDGVTAVEATSSNNYCSPDAYGTLSCGCSSVNRYWNYTLEGVDIADACDLGTQVCNNEVPFAADPVCETTYETSNTSYCSLQRNCAQVLDLGGGAMASLNQPEYSYCQFTSEQPATCNCSNNVKNMNFQMDVAAGPDACDSAAAICTSTAEIVPEGPIECARASQSSGTTYCDASIACAQDAVVDGATIGVIGNLYTNCQLNGDVWTCSCNSSTDSTSFDVTAPDGWEACTQATVQCPELVEIDITASGGGYYR
jgi:hypothetical protein